MAYLSKYTRAAIIGIYRMGVDTLEISNILNIPEVKVKDVINKYFKNRKEDFIPDPYTTTTKQYPETKTI